MLYRCFQKGKKKKGPFQTFFPLHKVYCREGGTCRKGERRTGITATQTKKQWAVDGPLFGYSQHLISFWIITNKTVHHNAYVSLYICKCKCKHICNTFNKQYFRYILEISKWKLDYIFDPRNLKANWLHPKHVWSHDNESKGFSEKQHAHIFLYQKHQFYAHVFDHFQSQSQFWIIWSGESQLSTVHKAPTWNHAGLHGTFQVDF